MKVNTRESKQRTVDGDAHKITDFLDLAASEANGTEIPENKVIIAAASLEPVAVAYERLSESTSVGNDLLGIELPLRLSNLLQSSGNCSDGLEHCQSI